MVRNVLPGMTRGAERGGPGARSWIPLASVLVLLLGYGLLPFVGDLVSSPPGPAWVALLGATVVSAGALLWVIIRVMASGVPLSRRHRRDILGVGAFCAAAYAVAAGVGVGSDPDLARSATFLALGVVFAASMLSARAGLLAVVVMWGAIALVSDPGFATRFAFAGMVGDLLGIRLIMWMRSVVTELAESRRRIAELRVDRERERFSRDLHDGMGRSLTSIALTADLALAEDPPAAVRRHLETVRETARTSLSGMRSLVRGYREISLTGEIEDALVLLRSNGVMTEVDGDDGVRLAPGAEQVAAWVVREAVTNILRHAPDASECTIRIDGGRIVVVNDGVPGAGSPTAGDGSGLDGLRQRVEAVGGTLHAGPEGTDSYVLRCTFPASESAGRS